MDSNSFVDFVLDQLSSIPRLQAKRMFSGHGLYAGEKFFGIIARGAVYFKTSEKTRGRYLRSGSAPFTPNAKQILKNYYSVPVEILEDRDQLIDWAIEAIDLGAVNDKKTGASPS